MIIWLIHSEVDLTVCVRGFLTVSLIGKEYKNSHIEILKSQDRFKVF